MNEQGEQPTVPAADLEAILELGRGAWEGLRGARLFVTGGTGFFGRWLLASFCYANRRLNLGSRAVVLSRNPSEFRSRAPELGSDPAIELWRGDVRWFELPKGTFTHIVHGAADTSQTAARQPLQLADTITTGTRRVLEFACASKAERLLYISSGAVYGEQPEAMDQIAEDYKGACDPLDPASTYGEAKRLAEHLCCVYARESALAVPIARPFAFVGSHLCLDCHFAIGNFIRDAIAGPTVEVKGDGTAVRSYLYAADLAVWLWTILTKGVSVRAYNVGSDRAITIADLAHTVAEAVSPGKPVRVAGHATDGGPRRRYVANIERARGELGLDVWTDLDVGIRRTAEWYRRRPSLGPTQLTQPGPKSKVLVVDFDGVLATLTPGNEYTRAGPLEENIAAVNRLYDAGHRIVLFTARGSATGLDWRALTEDQCAEWGVKYHELRFGKPAADYYVDDRMLPVDALRYLT